MKQTETAIRNIQRIFPFMDDTRADLVADVLVMVGGYFPNLRKCSPLLLNQIVVHHPDLNRQESRMLNSRRKTYHHLATLSNQLTRSVHPSQAKRLHRIASMLAK
ncbi:hypothetical protein 18_00020 [Pseudomonas phage Epa18]|nr:hypothetical protein 18_00020 [Pseudomonas phage Epa18]WKW89013.1 hypothetical protein LSL4_gp162 [Pseudomonas phage LSL4]